MATTTVYGKTSYNATCNNASQALDPPDNTWYGEPNTASSCSVDVFFDISNTLGSLNTGSGLQSFGVYVRKGTNNNNPSVGGDVVVFVSASEINDVFTFSSQTVTSSSGSWFDFSWDASVVGAADLTNVGFRVQLTGATGSPANRNSPEIDAVRWVVDYSAPVSKISLGDLSVSDLYVGDLRVRKAYLGDINVFS